MFRKVQVDLCQGAPSTRPSEMPTGPLPRQAHLAYRAQHLTTPMLHPQLGSLPAQGITKKFLFKWARPFFPALLGKLWKEVKSSPGWGEAMPAGSHGAGCRREQQGAVRGVSPGEKAARTVHAGSAEETVPGRARRCRSGCRRASAGSGRAAAGSPSSRRQFCRRHWMQLRKP